MLAGVVLLLLILIALLAIPLTVEFRVSRRQALSGEMTLVWLFGLLRIPVPLQQDGKPFRNRRKARRKRDRGQSGSGGKTSPMAAIRQRGFRRRLFRFVSDLWHAIQKKNLKLSLRVGLGDPADTGELWALVGPVAGMLASVRKASIDIRPEFMDACLELDGSGSIRLIPLRIVGLVGALMLSPAVWRGIGKMRATA